MSNFDVTIASCFKSWIDERVAKGQYDCASDLVNALIQREIEASGEETGWLKGLIAKGLASGILETEPQDVIAEIISEYPAKSWLSPT